MGLGLKFYLPNDFYLIVKEHFLLNPTKGVTMSFKETIEKEINNPPIRYTDSKNPYVGIKSSVDNLQRIILEIADEIDRINSKIKRYMGA